MLIHLFFCLSSNAKWKKLKRNVDSSDIRSFEKKTRNEERKYMGISVLLFVARRKKVKTSNRM
jgi:hypothetical protein